MSPQLSSPCKHLSITEFVIFPKKPSTSAEINTYKPLAQVRFFAFRRHLRSILRNESQYSKQKIRFHVEVCLISSLQALFNGVSTSFHRNSRKFGSGNTLCFFSPSAILDSGSNRMARNSICRRRGRGHWVWEALDFYRLSIESASG